MEAIKEAIIEVLKEDLPMTCRQVFYRLVSVGAIGKTEAEYKGTVIRLLCDMRRAKEIPFDWIADNTRWMRKPVTHGSLAQALNRTAETYRRSVWDNQDAYVEVWLEKESLAGVVAQVTRTWDVPLMVTRGYPSLSFLHSAAETIAAESKPSFLYYLGDHDPSGVDITRAVEEGIREMAPDTDLTFERIAITRDQIATMKLATRPTKKTDSRSKGFEGDSIEVDAIPPKVLRKIVETSIVGHIDGNSYRSLKKIEAAEAETVREIAGRNWQRVTTQHFLDARQFEAQQSTEDDDDEAEGN
jgi:hypothetical protein